MKKHSIIGIWRAILLLLLVTGATKAFAQDIITKAWLVYETTSANTVKLHGVTDDMPDNISFTLPSTITDNNNTYTLTAIGNAFSNTYNDINTRLRSISIPSTVTSIEASAFAGCTNLVGVNIYGQISSIGSGAFQGCTSLYAFDFSCITATQLSDNCFAGCTSLTEAILPEGMLYVNHEAFYGCTNLKKLSFPSTVSQVHARVIQGCTNLQTVNFFRATPPSAMSDESLYNPGVSFTIRVPEGCIDAYMSNPYTPNDPDRYGIIPADEFLIYSYDENNYTATVTNYVTGISGDLVIPGIVTHRYESFPVNAIAPNTFNSCILTSVVIPESVTCIADGTFCNCMNMTSVTLPANLTSIEASAFGSCLSLTSIDLPNDLSDIGNFAFSNTRIATLTIPATVSSIGNGAFQDCLDAIQSVYVMRATPPTLGENAFAYLTNTPTLYVPYGSLSVYQNSDWNDWFEGHIVELPADLQYSYDDVTHTATVTGYGGGLSETIEVPATVTYNNEEYTVTAIGDNAFKNFGNLIEIILPNTITSIGVRSFQNCRQTTINIPESLSSLGEGAFTDCDNLTEVTLPATLTSVPALAFYSCNGLTTLTLPATMTSLGIRAFYGCNNLSTINSLAATAPSCSEGTFQNVPSSCRVNVPMGCYDAYENAAGWSSLSIYTGGITYTLDDVNHTATITGCTENTFGTLIIPATLMNGTYTVTAIANNAFNGNGNISSVSIPASVTTIGNSAFSNCQSLTAFTVDASNASYKSDNGIIYSKDGEQLVAYPVGKTETSFTIPASVESITNYAFEGNKHLTTIQLSAAFNLISHVPSAFYGIDNLEAITIDAGNTYFKAIDGVLFSDDETNLIYCPRGKAGHYTVPSTVTYILDQAFADCAKLTGITLNDGLVSIEMYAFARCTGLTSISIPEGITNIYMCTFMGCTNLQTVNLPTSLNNIAQFAFAQTGLISLTLPENIADIGNNAFSECVNLGEVTLNSLYLFVPSGQNIFNGIDTSEIPLYVNAAQLNNFASNAPWKYFDVHPWPTPNGYLLYAWSDVNNTAVVTGVSDSQAISGDLVIPGTLTRNNKTYTVYGINEEALKDCVNLTSVTIPATVHNIGNKAFQNCTGITSIVIGKNVKTIGSTPFYGCSSLTEIVYGAVDCQNVSTDIWENTSAMGKTLTIKNNVQTIPAYCFNGLQGLNEATVTIPDKVTSIGDEAFRNCDLKGVSIGSGMTTIGISAFEYSGLESVDVPSNVKNIERYAFRGCESLISANVWGAEIISVGMFKDCTALTSFDVKSPTKMINSDAFANCTSLATVTTAGYASNLTTIGQEAFTGCTALTAIDIPNSVTTIRDYAFAGDNALETVTFGTGLQSVGFAAFYYCYSLESVTFNATHCNSFSSKVWEGTGNDAKTLTIGTNVNVIPSRAFENLKGFSNITLPNGLTEINYNAFNGCSLTSVTIPNNVTRIGTEAFQNCPLTTLSIGSKVNRIGSDAFNGDSNYLQTITSYNTTPPNIDGPTFHDDAYTNATLKVLGNDAVTAYQNHVVWSRFITIESLDGYYFTGATDNNWGTASNWSNGEVPTSDPLDPSGTEYNPDFTPNVVIMADATVNIPNAYANKLTIMNGNVVTVTNGNKLYIGNYNATYSAANASALVIEEGGQLWNDIDVSATVEKNINGYDRGGDDWHFISSPLKGTQFDDTYGYYIEPDDIDNLISGDYDLYKFDQSQEGAQWQNYKYGNNADSFHIFEGMGYLYANATNTKLDFAGAIASNEYEKSVNLYYIDGMTFTGFNLVGNPLACTAYINSMYGFDNLNFYKMNEAGNDIVAVQNISGTPIAACEGILVQTDMSTSTLSFVRELDPMMMNAPNNGSVNITLTKGNERYASAGSANVIDNAIVSFNEGSRLEKFIFNEETSKLYIPQDGTDYAIVSSTGFGELPLNFRAKESDIYTINFRNDNAEMKTLRLIDKIEDKEIDLIANPSYTFVGTPIDREDRFTLMFNASANSTTFAYQDGSDIVVCGNGELQIFDMMGRHITSYNVNGIETVRKPAQSGVYILRIVGDDMKTQKIVVR